MFDRYGGFTSVSRVVSAFYERALESEILEPYFMGVDMRSLINHQTKFIASIMGGPASFSDSELARVHARLNVTELAFNEMVTLLSETLEDFDYAASDIDELKKEILKRKSVIVSAGTP